MLFLEQNLPKDKRIVIRQIADYIINVGMLADSNTPFLDELTSILRESFKRSIEAKTRAVFKELMKREPTCEEKKEFFTTMATFLIDKSAGDPLEGIKVLKAINEDKIKEFADALWVEPEGCSDSEIAESYLKAILKATSIVNKEIERWVKENGLEKEYERLKTKAILINLRLGEKVLTSLISNAGMRVPLVEKSLAKIRKWRSYYNSKLT